MEKNFECPAGLPWLTPETAGEFADVIKKISTTKAPPSLAQQRIEAHCINCEHFRDRRCLLYRAGHCSPCEFAAYLNQLGAICPARQVVFA
ncbi:MAG: hypothetical protein HZA50_16690 [Planctomycetes bacterium]|nr:hypothetical protein [Planctomycetota bacterium]